MSKRHSITSPHVQLGLVAALSAGSCVAPPMPPRPAESIAQDTPESRAHTQFMYAFSAALQESIDERSPEEVLGILKDIAIKGLVMNTMPRVYLTNHAVFQDPSDVLKLKLYANDDDITQPSSFPKQTHMLEADITPALQVWKYMERHGIPRPDKKMLEDCMLRVLHDSARQPRFSDKKIAGFTIADISENRIFGAMVQEGVRRNVGAIAECVISSMDDFGKTHVKDTMETDWYQKKETAREKAQGRFLIEQLKRGQQKYREAIQKESDSTQSRQ